MHCNRNSADIHVYIKKGVYVFYAAYFISRYSQYLVSNILRIKQLKSVVFAFLSLLRDHGIQGKNGNVIISDAR